MHADVPLAWVLLGSFALCVWFEDLSSFHPKWGCNHEDADWMR